MGTTVATLQRKLWRLGSVTLLLLTTRETSKQKRTAVVEPFPRHLLHAIYIYILPCGKYFNFKIICEALWLAYTHLLTHSAGSNFFFYILFYFWHLLLLFLRWDHIIAVSITIEALIYEPLNMSTCQPCVFEWNAISQSLFLYIRLCSHDQMLKNKFCSFFFSFML